MTSCILITFWKISTFTSFKKIPITVVLIYTSGKNRAETCHIYIYIYFKSLIFHQNVPNYLNDARECARLCFTLSSYYENIKHGLSPRRIGWLERQLRINPVRINWDFVYLRFHIKHKMRNEIYQAVLSYNTHERDDWFAFV